MTKLTVDQVLGKEKIKGMNFGFNCKTGFYASSEARHAVDEIADLGCNWVCVMTSLVQDTFASTKVYHDYVWTPDDHELEEIIRAFHARGVKVMLKIINLPLDGVWMGAIRFPGPGVQIEGVHSDYWTSWFQSFGNGLVHYGRLLERCKADLFCLSGELHGAQDQDDHWRRVIERVRQVYSGPVTYEMSCIDPERDILPWYEDLDFVCLSSYPPAALSPKFANRKELKEYIYSQEDKPCPSVDEMTAYIRENELEQHRKIAQAIGHPYFFAETGCCSAAGVSCLPFTIHGRKYRPEEQLNYFEALMQVFNEEDWFRGFFWWKWDEQQDRPQYKGDPAGDTGFIVKGKPVFKKMQKYFKNS